MNEIQVTHGRIDQSLKRRQADALEDARSQQALVVGATGSRPRAAHDDNHIPEQEQMSFPPDARRGNKQETRDSDTAEMVARQQGDIRKRALELDGHSDGVGGHDGTAGCADDGDEAEDGEDEVAAP